MVKLSSGPIRGRKNMFASGPHEIVDFGKPQESGSYGKRRAPEFTFKTPEGSHEESPIDSLASTIGKLQTPEEGTDSPKKMTRNPYLNPILHPLPIFKFQSETILN